MIIHAIPTNPLQENTYIIRFADKRAVIIDCGAFNQREKEHIRSYLDEQQLTPVAHLLTHGHFDHCFGVRFIYETYGLKPVMADADAFLLRDQVHQMRSLTGMDYPEEPFTEYLPLKDYDLSPIHCKAYPTPGHTPGGVCYLFDDNGEQALFSGDTLFLGSIGRTDHDGGNFTQLIQSIQTQLMTLPDQLTVYPGHGPKTTIGFERQYNPYL